MSYPVKNLSELCDIVIGRTPARKEPRYWGVGNKWVSISDLTSKVVCETKEEITNFAVQQVGPRKIPKGTLLFSFKLTIGKMAFAGCDLYTNEAIAALLIKNRKELCEDYLYYALRVAKLTGSNQAAMGKTLNSKSLALIEIYVPPIEVQKRIAHLLGIVEELIAQRKNHIQQLDDLLKSAFLEMFGDPVRNTMGWDKPELKQFGEISTGNTPPRKDPSNYSNKYIEWIKTGNISSESVFISQAIEHLSETGVVKARTVKRGALLVACIAGSLESIGRAALTDRTVAFNQQINAIQPYKDVNPFYLYVLFRISKAYIQSQASKGMKKILTKGEFEKITMVKPPIDLQNQFATIVIKVDSIKSHYKQSLSDLENLYGALGQKAFKGELGLTRVVLPAEEKEAKEEMSIEEHDTAETETETAIELRAPDDLQILSSADGRKTVITKWLDTYLDQLGNTAFSAEQFMDIAQQKLLELMEDESPDLGVEEYNHVKALVFKLLESGHMKQTYDDDDNAVQIYPVKV